MTNTSIKKVAVILLSALLTGCMNPEVNMAFSLAKKPLMKMQEIMADKASFEKKVASLPNFYNRGGWISLENLAKIDYQSFQKGEPSYVNWNFYSNNRSGYIKIINDNKQYLPVAYAAAFYDGYAYANSSISNPALRVYVSDNMQLKILHAKVDLADRLLKEARLYNKDVGLYRYYSVEREKLGLAKLPREEFNMALQNFVANRPVMIRDYKMAEEKTAALVKKRVWSDNITLNISPVNEHERAIQQKLNKIKFSVEAIHYDDGKKRTITDIYVYERDSGYTRFEIEKAVREAIDKCSVLNAYSGGKISTAQCLKKLGEAIADWGSVAKKTTISDEAWMYGKEKADSRDGIDFARWAGMARVWQMQH